MAYTQSNNILGNRIQDLNIGAPCLIKCHFALKSHLHYETQLRAKPWVGHVNHSKKKNELLWNFMAMGENGQISFNNYSIWNGKLYCIEEGYLGLQAVP